MPLTDHEKSDLRSSLATLIDLDEPEALLGTLRQVAQRQAEHNLTPPDVAQRWQHLANALAEAELTIEQTNTPKANASAKAQQDANLGYRQASARQTTNAEMTQANTEPSQPGDDATALQQAITKAIG